MEKNSFEAVPQFKSPEEEIVFLRAQLAERENSAPRAPDGKERERIAEDVVAVYRAEKSESVLAPQYRATRERTEQVALKLSPEEHDKTMEELLGYMQENGIKNTLDVVGKLNNPHIADDFHRFLVQYVASRGATPGIKEGTPLFRTLNMKLYEIALPKEADEEGQKHTFKEMVAAMEQFYAGMLSVGDTKNPVLGRNYFTIEIALPHIGSEVVFYAAVPRAKEDLFAKQIHAVFPHAKIEEKTDDYNVFNDGGASVGAIAKQVKNPIYPLKTYDTFEHDPLNVILNVFARLKEEGEGAAVQLVIAPAGAHFVLRYGHALDKIRKGVPVKKAINMPETFIGEMGKEIKELFLGSGAAKKGESPKEPVDDVAVEQIKEKVGSTIMQTNIRVIASARTEPRARAILADLESAFNQFTNTQGNGIKFEERKGRGLLRFFSEFSYRTFSEDDGMPFNLKELTTVVHFPVIGTESPHLREAKAGSASAPLDLPKEGTLLGINRYRVAETKVYIGKEDRVRHFYVIGQTGTGKTVLIKNMILQDIRRGDGVCYIDPHGTDIVDILANIPPERIDDVIYFDPASTARPMGLNMLEYDVSAPEQKTFVVNELFGIFQKLYEKIPESMGPAFEQYFRNATMLVIEDPESGSTLLDISRVMVDPQFREMKLSKCKNPIVTQFWRDIATKTTGEQALANYAPYVTNKFDVFTANDIIRPIIAQQKSAFNFREIMDNKKILLVNLSKGRLGDINANLIGLVLVGKILMAALSRVDMVGKKEMNDFYLYIDEFQNITTPSIAIILSEARKYRLSLNIAHQFIAQLSEDIKNAVFGNVGSMAIFRVGAEDAKFLEPQLAPTFKQSDIVNIDNWNAYVRMLANGRPVKPFNIQTMPPPKGNPAIVEKLKELSALKYGRPREEVEEEIARRYRREPPPMPPHTLPDR